METAEILRLTPIAPPDPYCPPDEADRERRPASDRVRLHRGHDRPVFARRTCPPQRLLAMRRGRESKLESWKATSRSGRGSLASLREISERIPF